MWDVADMTFTSMLLEENWNENKVMNEDLQKNYCKINR